MHHSKLQYNDINTGIVAQGITKHYGHVFICLISVAEMKNFEEQFYEWDPDPEKEPVKQITLGCSTSG
jgi:hypothetical protein